jgi:hypothetical protein
MWSANFEKKVAENSVEWDVPTEEVSDLQTATTAFAELHAKADSPERNPVIVSVKNSARKTLLRKIRGLVNFRLKNPVITDEQRIEMGLHVRDARPSNIPAPTSFPELLLEVRAGRRLKVVFRDMGSSSKAKPYGVNGAVIAYDVLDSPPTSQDQLSHSELATHTPYILEFKEDKRGKKVYVACYWQNEKGEKGPWSDIASAFVP